MIILLENIFKTAIWGGSNLQKIFNVNSPYEKTSEVWTASAHTNGITPIKKTLSQDMKNKAEDLSILYKLDTAKRMFGLNCLKYEEFPLLAKWIDANDKLSVQVHPDDKYAMLNYNSFGKTEAWYIVSAKPDAKIIYGLKENITKDDLRNAINKNKIEEVLNYVPVKEGEIFYIPSGTVHALLDGVVVYEIQQSSDITYRLFDWNRVGNDGKPRQLHIEQALDVINFSKQATIQGEDLTSSAFKYFSIEKHKVIDVGSICVTNRSFKLCSVLNGTICITDGEKKYDVKAGESFILTAANSLQDTYKVLGTGTILESECN